MVCHIPSMQESMPCVGIVAIAGCLTFVLAPDQKSTPTLSTHPPETLPVVVLDPGHGGIDDGAHSNGLLEKELTLDVAQRAERFLQAFGFQTALTRRDNRSTVSLEQRAAIANQYDHSVFVSLHFDKTEHASANGVAVFYPERKATARESWSWAGIFDAPPEVKAVRDEELAGHIQAAMLSRTEANNRGIKARDLYVVRNVRSPAVLVEGGFLSNVFDARLVGTPEYRERLAASIVEGILIYQRMETREAAEQPGLASVAH